MSIWTLHSAAAGITAERDGYKERDRRMRQINKQSTLGFSQIEVAMSTLIVGLMVVTALNTAGAAMRSQVGNGDRGRGMVFGSALMAEILEQAFEDPNQTPVFGVESGEATSPVTRVNFDDVDDYHGWSSVPQDKAGNVSVSGTGLTTVVTVALADPNALGSATPPSPSSVVKKVNVTVQQGASVVCTLTAVVTK